MIELPEPYRDALVTVLQIRFGPLDRLRLLLRGHLHVRAEILTENEIGAQEIRDVRVRPRKVWQDSRTEVVAEAGPPEEDEEEEPDSQPYSGAEAAQERPASAKEAALR